MSSNTKTPPLLSSSKDYSSWKKSLKIWSNFTTLENSKQGAAVFLTLDGPARDAVLEVPDNDISSDSGLQLVLQRLDDLYLQDETLQKYELFDAFDNYKRQSSTPISEFLHQFNLLYNKLSSHGTTISDDLLAYKLLKAANLSSDHEKLAKATCELKYKSMKEQLKKIFSDMSTSSSPAPFKLNEINQCTSTAQHSWYNNTSQTSCDPVSNNNEDLEEETFFTRSNSNRQRYPMRNQYNRNQYNRQYNRRYYSPAKKVTFEKKGLNPVDPSGKTTRCEICDSINHWASACPDRQRKPTQTYFTDEYNSEETPVSSNDITLFQSDFDNPHQLTGLVAESWLHAVLDSGASATVCGQKWFDNYVDCLSSSDRQKVTVNPKRSGFRFGDGNKVMSTQTACLPAYIGNDVVTINTAIVNKNIPLLLSRASMKTAAMSINFLTDTVDMAGQSIPLNITTSGHYTLPLTSETQTMQNFQRSPIVSNNATITFHVNRLSDGATISLIAKKIHRQFAHAPANKLITLLENSDSMYKNDKKLKIKIKEVVDNCEICKLYKKPSSTPVVGLPLATRFQETVALDLKFYKGKIILHLIDHATRLSQAVRISSKLPRVIVSGIFDKWISVYGSSERFLTDNGGEFVNEELLSLCEQFGIVLKTTPAESPWCNGMIERHNLILSNMLDRVLEDFPEIPFDIALQWCNNSKNSLSNIHGFSSYQLSIGRNPTLPSLLTDKPPAYNSKPSSEIVRNNLNALHRSRKAFIESENSEKIRRALSHNVRTNVDHVYVSGDYVLYKRASDTKWRGPAVVLGRDGQQHLLKHGGFYIRVHQCRLQHAPRDNENVSCMPTEDCNVANSKELKPTEDCNVTNPKENGDDTDSETESCTEHPIDQIQSTPLQQVCMPHTPQTPSKALSQIEPQVNRPHPPTTPSKFRYHLNKRRLHYTPCDQTKLPTYDADTSSSIETHMTDSSKSHNHDTINHESSDNDTTINAESDTSDDTNFAVNSDIESLRRDMLVKVFTKSDNKWQILKVISRAGKKIWSLC